MYYYNRKIKIGEKFGSLKTLGNEENIKGILKCKCQCKCGNIKYYAVRGLLSGIFISCGCIKKKPINEDCNGESSTRFYGIWRGIKSRCNKITGEKQYGRRGIKCERKTYKQFKNDMYESYLEHIDKYGEKQTTIDRINNDGNYCKENCKRSTRKEQVRNRRLTIKRYIDGFDIPFAELCDKYGLDYRKTYYHVYKKGESFKKILIDNGHKC